MRRLFRCLLRKHGEGKGEWRRDAAKGGAWHLQPVPGGTMSPLPERISSGSLGPVNLLSDPRGVKFGTSTLPGVPAALRSPWLVPTVAAGQVGVVCTGVVCPALLAHLPLRSRGPAHLRGAGACVAHNPRLGCRHSHGTPSGHHHQQRQCRPSRMGPQPCLDLQAGDGGAACSGVPRISKGNCMYACVCVCLICRTLLFKILVSYLQFRSALQKLKINVKS